MSMADEMVLWLDDQLEKDERRNRTRWETPGLQLDKVHMDALLTGTFRKCLTRHSPVQDNDKQICPTCSRDHGEPVLSPCIVLLRVASDLSERPGYRDEWRHEHQRRQAELDQAASTATIVRRRRWRAPRLRRAFRSRWPSRP